MQPVCQSWRSSRGLQALQNICHEKHARAKTPSTEENSRRAWRVWILLRSGISDQIKINFSSSSKILQFNFHRYPCPASIVLMVLEHGFNSAINALCISKQELTEVLINNNMDSKTIKEDIRCSQSVMSAGRAKLETNWRLTGFFPISDHVRL